MKKNLLKVVVFLNISKYQGGAERRIARYSNYLIKKHLANVRLLVWANEPDFKSFVDIYFAKDNNCGRCFNISSIHNLIKYLMLWKPDIFQFFDCSGSLLHIYILGKLFSKRIVSDMASYTMCEGRFYSSLGSIICKRVLKLCDGIFCLYPHKTDELRHNLENVMMFREKLPLIQAPSYSFTDIDRFKPCYEKIKTIVFAARLVESKNPLLFLDVIQKKKDILRKLNYKVILCGTGILNTKILKEIEDNNISDIVVFTEYIDVLSCLRKSRIFFSIQKYENYPSQSLMEAIACGNYIIASNGGATHRMLRKNFSSMLDLDVDLLSRELENVLYLMEDSKFLKNVVLNARIFSETHFKICSFAEEILSFWRALF